MDSDPDLTGSKQDTRFVRGQSGNPSGRPKGARSRLGERFIEALAADFDQHGVATIEKVRTRDPTGYVKVIKDVLPREVLVQAFSVNATIDLAAMEEAQGFLQAYRFARDRIGAVPLIDAQPLEADEGAVHTNAWRADHD